MKRFSLLLVLAVFLSCEKQETELEIVSGKIIALQAESNKNHNILVSEYQYDTTKSDLDFSNRMIIYLELTTNKNEIDNFQGVKEIEHIGLSWGEIYLENKGFPKGYHDFFYPITSFPAIIDSNLLSLYSGGPDSVKNIIMRGYQIPFPVISLPMEKRIFESKRLHDIEKDYNNGNVKLMGNKIQLIFGMSTNKVGLEAKINGQLELRIGYKEKSLIIIDSLSLKKRKTFDFPAESYYLDMSRFE